MRIHFLMLVAASFAFGCKKKSDQAPANAGGEGADVATEREGAGTSQGTLPDEDGLSTSAEVAPETGGSSGGVDSTSGSTTVASGDVVRPDVVIAQQPDPVKAALVPAPMISVGNDMFCARDALRVRCRHIKNLNEYPVPAFANPEMVSVGYFHGCVIDQDTAKCWWLDGIDRSSVYTQPVVVVPHDKLGRALQVASGRFHACAISADRGVVCWGDNAAGQTVVPEGIVEPRTIVAGDQSTCVLAKSGVQCWGHPKVRAVPALSAPSYLSVMGPTACAVDGGRVRCWGECVEGADPVRYDLLHCRPDFAAMTARPELALEQAAMVTVAERYGCAVMTSGSVRCWGLLPNPAWDPRPPKDIVGAVRSIDSWLGATCVVDGQGPLCWIANAQRFAGFEFDPAK